MKWLFRLFNPELITLRSERNWFERQFTAASERVAALERELRLEINANRKREDALRAEIIKLAGARPPTPRDAEDASPDVTIAESYEALSERDTEVLWERAGDYCKSQFGADFSNAQQNTIFEQMKADPANWLTNF